MSFISILTVMNWHKLLNKAWEKISAKKMINGEYTLPYLQSFANNYKTRLAVIERHLKRKDYFFGKWKATFIPKKDGGNRPLIIPVSISDKIVLKAVSDYLSNALSQVFNEVRSISYAYQKGKSARDALIQLKKMHNPKNILLKIDIKHFFDEIDRDIIMQLINQYPINDYVKNLIYNSINPLVDYSNLEKSELAKFPKGGIPQGNSISSILSNLYLLELDKLAVSKGWRMVRYADDMVFSVSNLKEAHVILSQVERFLTDHRKLTIHPLGKSSDSKTAIFQNPKKNKMEYLGINFDGEKLLPTKERRWLLIKKIRNILESTSTSDVKEAKIKEAISQWCGYYAFTDITDSQIKWMNSAINHQIGKSNLNIRVINIIDTISKARKRQNSKFARLFYPIQFGEEFAWLNLYN